MLFARYLIMPRRSEIWNVGNVSITDKMIMFFAISFHSTYMWYHLLRTYMHTYIHTYIHTCIHATHTYINKYINTCIHAYIYLHTYVWTYVCDRIHTNIYVWTNMYNIRICMYISENIDASVQRIAICPIWHICNVCGNLAGIQRLSVA